VWILFHFLIVGEQAGARVGEDELDAFGHQLFAGLGLVLLVVAVVDEIFGIGLEAVEFEHVVGFRAVGAAEGYDVAGVVAWSVELVSEPDVVLGDVVVNAAQRIVVPR
jgi:hypothetical protein